MITERDARAKLILTSAENRRWQQRHVATLLQRRIYDRQPSQRLKNHATPQVAHTERGSARWSSLIRQPD